MTPLPWRRVLVVAAHPDDEVLGCGATITRLAHEAADVHILILGEGHTSRFPSRDHANVAGVAALADAAQRVGVHLGAGSVRLAGLADNRLDSIDLLDLVKLVESHSRDVKPDTVITHFSGDVNIDHRLTLEAVLAATRPGPDGGVNSVLMFEVASSTDWAFGALGRAFAPTVFVDVSGFATRKVEAMNIYETEMPPFPHPRSAEALRAQLAWRGSAIGCAAAEAFMPLRLIH